MTQVELLSPAGDFEKLQFAIAYGADAVYVGGRMCNLRALADNFEDTEFLESIEYAHSHHRKVFVTLNAIPHDASLKLLPEYISFLNTSGVDAVIVADLGIFSLVKKYSSLPIHISTQASATNSETVRMWHSLGAKRIVLARELSLAEITEIRQNVPDVELEVFAHGAMCISISGRCFLSQWMANRDANQGLCTHSCRWKYSLVEEKRPGEFFAVSEDENGSYLLNSKDLCTINILDKIVATGINSIKLEGRMKGIYYTSVVTKAYREALDNIKNNRFTPQEHWMTELSKVSHRQFTSGFYVEKPTAEAQKTDTAKYTTTHTLVAKVLGTTDNGTSLLEVRNRFAVPSSIEVITPAGLTEHHVVTSFLKAESNLPLAVAHAGMKVLVKFPTPPPTFSLCRQLIENKESPE